MKFEHSQPMGKHNYSGAARGNGCVTSRIRGRRIPMSRHKVPLLLRRELPQCVAPNSPRNGHQAVRTPIGLGARRQLSARNNTGRGTARSRGHPEGRDRGRMAHTTETTGRTPGRTSKTAASGRPATAGRRTGGVMPRRAWTGAEKRVWAGAKKPRTGTLPTTILNPRGRPTLHHDGRRTRRTAIHETMTAVQARRSQKATPPQLQRATVLWS